MSEFQKQCESLIADCQKCAAFLEEKPGLGGPHQIIDLYKAVARLAMIVKQADGLARIPATNT